MENVTYGKFYLWQTYYGKCELQNVTDTCLKEVSLQFQVILNPLKKRTCPIHNTTIYHINDEGYHNGSNLKSIKF